MADLPDLPSRLRHARELGGVSARKLDEISGLATGHTWMIESGHRGTPELATAAKLARALGVSIDWLAFGTGKAPTASSIKAALGAAA